MHAYVRTLACVALAAAITGCDTEDPDLSTQVGPSGGGPSGGGDSGALPQFDSGLPPFVQPPGMDGGSIFVPPLQPPDGGGVASGANVPCDVAAIISQKCALCHGATPKFGAPMRLMSVADFQAQAPITMGQAVHKVANLRVASPPVGAPMPPPGTVAPLTEAERTKLTQWLTNGAQGAANGCPVTEPQAATPDGGVSGPKPTSGVSITPYEGWDEGVECYKFLAHDGSKRAPYPVGIAIDSYTSFNLMPPWQGARYVRSFRAIVDNAQALHHYLLFDEGGPVSDGNITTGTPVHPTSELLQGWAPGGSDLYFSPDVGPEMLSSNGYTLEIHYNSSDPLAVDASGVEVCVTAQKPTNVITRSWVGTDSIFGSTSASGVCDPSSNERIHIVLGTPHMHLKGRHMKVVVNRANGSDEVVHDEAFAFENQRDYPEDLWIEPGDTITTTCTFSEPATFGASTSQEMCYWFAMHYPEGALTDNGLIAGALHGSNTCLGGL